MFQKTFSSSAILLVLACLAVTSGCNTTFGPGFGLLSYPVPVSPFFQDQLEDDFWEHERYETVPILGPLTEGGPVMALDPPSDDEVMRALEKARPTEGGIPLLHEVQRNNVRIVVEPIADYIDPIRVYPMMGPAQLHHAHYKCTIYFTEVTRPGWPVPHTKTNEDAQEVIYIDHNHYHIAGNVSGGSRSNY